MQPHRSKLEWLSRVAEGLNQKQMRLTDRPSIVVSFLLVALFIIALIVCFEPRWETNDDVGMSMVAHGYGIAAFGSPNLIFSNVIWGHIVRAIPDIGGTLGYSTATYAVLSVVGAVVLHGVARIDRGAFLPILFLVIALARPILLPQFTLNAGLLLVATTVCWHYYARFGSKSALVLGCILAFFSALVRFQEFLLVFAIAVPILPKELISQREAQISILTLAIAIAAAVIADHLAYSGDAWAKFNELNLVRAAFTDFGVLDRCSFGSQMLKPLGLTANDLRLIASWFFVDANIADPTKLSELLARCSFFSDHNFSLASLELGFSAIFSSYLLITSLCAILILIVFPSGRVVASWILFFLAIAVMGFLGRPAVARVYFPIICLLMLSPVLLQIMDGTKFIWRRRLIFSSLPTLAMLNLILVGTEAGNGRAAQAEESLADLPNSLVVTWGAAFPFEQVYPVIGQNRHATSYHLYGLGAFTQAPFSVATAEAAEGRDFKTLLTRPEGLDIVSDDTKIELLAQYCNERLDGSLIGDQPGFRRKTLIFHARCLPRH